MSFINQTSRAKVVTATTPVIYNKTSPVTANTEFSQALGTSVKRLMIRSREECKIQLAFVPGESGTNYITIEPCAVFYEDNLDLNGKILYMQVDQTSQKIEILEWS